MSYVRKVIVDVIAPLREIDPNHVVVSAVLDHGVDRPSGNGEEPPVD